MYKILIVDNNSEELKHNMSLLKSINNSFVIKGIKSGKEAEKYLRNNETDILITEADIDGISGIDLIKTAGKNEANSGMKSLIVSRDSDFNVAREAIRNGVSDYLNKPVSSEEMKESIDRILEDIASQKLDTELKEIGMSSAKQYRLYNMITGEGAGDMPEVDIDVEIEDYSRIMLIEFNNDFYGRHGGRFEKKLDECIDIPYHYLNLNPEQSILLFEEKDRDADFWKLTAAKIQNYLESVYRKKCFIAISSEIKDDNQMKKAMEEVENLIENKFYQLTSRVYINESDEENSSEAHVDDDTLMKQMKQDIKMKDSVNLREHFEKLCDKYRDKTTFSQVYIKFIFANLLKDFYEVLPNVGELELNNEIERLYKAADFQTVIDIINANIERLEAAFQTNPQMIHREIESVKQYIYEHYGEEIGVEQLADMVYMAPSYLSCIFKKETGQNLSKFIKAYRMEKAKEMLQETHKKIVVISNEVGYSNVSYFCQSFREYYGISPQKFRSSGDVD